MKKNNSLDGHTRKRIYLFRHGEVNYMPEGKVVKDPNEVDLTDKGLMQARLIDKNTKNIHFRKNIKFRFTQNYSNWGPYGGKKKYKN